MKQRHLPRAPLTLLAPAAGLAIVATLVTMTLLSPMAQANIGDTYGFGSRTAGLAGANAAWGFEGYAAYNNPAGLSVFSEKRLIVSYGLIDMVPSFDDINNVIVENTFTSDKIRYGNVN